MYSLSFPCPWISILFIFVFFPLSPKVKENILLDVTNMCMLLNEINTEADLRDVTR